MLTTDHPAKVDCRMCKLSLQLFVFSCLLASCVAPHDAHHAVDTCQVGNITLRGDFAGGALGLCSVLRGGQVILKLQPEDEPINPSPWYSFVAEGRGQVSVVIDYGDAAHRYQPKVSVDGERWHAMEDTNFSVAADGKSMRLELNVEDELYVSAQENMHAQTYDEWLAPLVHKYPSLRKSVIGRSAQGRPIWAVQTNPDAGNTIVLVGRQHPPEVTGAIAMRSFVERLLQYHPDYCGESEFCGFYNATNIRIYSAAQPRWGGGRALAP